MLDAPPRRRFAFVPCLAAAASLTLGLAGCLGTSENPAAEPVPLPGADASHDAHTGSDAAPGDATTPTDGAPGDGRVTPADAAPDTDAAPPPDGARPHPDTGADAAGPPPGPDLDHDGTANADDNCPDVANPTQRDADGDGTGDACDDGDTDHDGVADRDDLCPTMDVRPLDGDADGVGDQCDVCPGSPDPSQADRDGDGLGDACDPCPEMADDGRNHLDLDGDGFLACAGDCDDARPAVHPGATEACNGVDDNCDGEADEAFPTLGSACSAGLGACTRDGLVTCRGADAVGCDAVPGGPLVEQCNAIDDDCDGQIDNGAPNCCAPGATTPCGTDEGLCQAGTQTCNAQHVWSVCNGIGAQPERCDGQDNDCDGQIDEDFDLTRDPENCNVCGHVCAAGSICQGGVCFAAPTVSVCGAAARDLSTLLRGPAATYALDPAHCLPQANTHALLLLRGGAATLAGHEAAVAQWVRNGGVMVTETSMSVEAVRIVLGSAPAAGLYRGNCHDELVLARVFNRDDPYWQDNRVLPVGDTGCGYALDPATMPGLVPLAGHDRTAAYLGYINVGRGRLWLVESNWADADVPVLSDGSYNGLAYMIDGGRNLGAPQCRNGVDDDGNGLVDLNDAGCTDLADALEGPNTPWGIVACDNGVDDDGNGTYDFPFDPGCLAAGDTTELAPAVAPVCQNGVDDDGDGWVDFPNDYGCEGAGDNDEVAAMPAPACGDLMDNDADGLVDYTRDLDCTSNMDTSESP